MVYNVRNTFLGRRHMNETTLKNRLIELKQTEFSFQNINLIELTTYMLKHLGSLDSELRDKLIYRTFCKMITNNYLSQSHLKQMLATILDDKYLFKGIGLKEDDSVFTRSFSTLLIALILDADNRKDFLSQDTVLLVKDCLLKYMLMEQDLRGYVKDKGWAHSIAHGADVLDELVKSHKLDQGAYKNILTIIINKVHVYDYAYHDDEDERLITPIIAMLQRGLPENDLIEYIEGISNYLEQKNKELAVENYWILYANTKSFLRSLHFRMRKHSEFEMIKKSVEHALDKISCF